MSSLYGENLKVSIFGQSHGPAHRYDSGRHPGGPACGRRSPASLPGPTAPGSSDLSTPRKEADKVEFLSGIVDGRTCGAPSLP